MPTTRPRHTITETDEIAAAIDDAAKQWPGERPGGLLRRLIGEGHRALRSQRSATRAARLEAVERTSGALTGVYPPGYLDRLRDEWRD